MYVAPADAIFFSAEEQYDRYDDGGGGGRSPGSSNIAGDWRDNFSWLQEQHENFKYLGKGVSGLYAGSMILELVRKE